jgi:hypothetical protein
MAACVCEIGIYPSRGVVVVLLLLEEKAHRFQASHLGGDVERTSTVSVH